MNTWIKGFPFKVYVMSFISGLQGERLRKRLKTCHGTEFSGEPWKFLDEGPILLVGQVACLTDPWSFSPPLSGRCSVRTFPIKESGVQGLYFAINAAIFTEWYPSPLSTYFILFSDLFWAAGDSICFVIADWEGSAWKKMFLDNISPSSSSSSSSSLLLLLSNLFISPLFLLLVGNPLCTSQKFTLVAVRSQSRSKLTSESAFPPHYSSQTCSLGTWGEQAFSASSSSCSSIRVQGGGSRTTAGYSILLSFWTWCIWCCGQKEAEMGESSLF